MAVINYFPTIATSGLTPVWFTNVATFIQGLQPTLTVPTLTTDCVSLGAELDTSAATGTGTCINATDQLGGVIKTASGVVLGSFRYAKNRGGATSPVVMNTRTSKYAVATLCKPVQIQATFALDLCGFTDEATFATAIECLQTVSATNYVLHVGSHAGQDTGQAFVLGTYVTLVQIADGTNVRAYLGTAAGAGIVQIGTAQAQSTAPNAAGSWLFNAQNLGTAANVEAHCDAALVLTERA